MAAAAGSYCSGRAPPCHCSRGAGGGGPLVLQAAAAAVAEVSAALVAAGLLVAPWRVGWFHAVQAPWYGSGL
eukprot:7999787-Alexandrium_andersonii.AAC.1